MLSSTRKSALGTESLVVSGDCLGVGGMSNICGMRREGRGRGGEREGRKRRRRGKGGRGGERRDRERKKGGSRKGRGRKERMLGRGGKEERRE